MSQTYWWQIPTSYGTGGNPVVRSDPGQETVHREVSFEMEAEGDGRTLYTRIVPYNTPVDVADPPFFEPYIEVWKPGVFDKQLRAANRVDVLLNFEHEQGIGGVVGRGVELRSEPDGLHGTFRLLSNQDGEKTRELVAEKVLNGMSLEATIIKSEREGDAVARTEARLRNVAICRRPAFPGAEVLAVRSGGEDEPPPDDPPDPDPDGESTAPEPAIVVPELVVRDDVSVALQRAGVTQLEHLTVTRAPWDGTSDRFSDEEYERSCLIIREGDGPPKQRCSLPILEPSGELNAGALVTAARMLPSVTRVTAEQRSDAARRLIRLYRMADLTPTTTMLDLARR